MNLTDLIYEAGVVGLGGAGFPTHVKLKGTYEVLIVNGAECEPMLRNDRWLMRHKAAEIVSAVTAIAKELSIPKAVICLKEHYEKETEALNAAIAAQNAPVSLHLMDSFYPAGDEQTMVYEVTGRVVPPAGLPGMVGAVVDNVATIYAIYEAMQGKPLTARYLTVTGEVKTPSVLYVPIGTPMLRCIELAGGAAVNDYYVISGGPMMGKPVTNLSTAVVTKTTSGILVLKKDCYHEGANAVQLKTMLNRARSACIQCSRCTDMCPRHLLGHPIEPHKIMRKMAVTADIGTALNDPAVKNAALCCECGICETYACPMGLQPRRINGAIKQALGAAGIRYKAEPKEYTASPLREMRKAPTVKVAARVGVHAYDSYEIDNLVTDEPEVITVPLRMHIGAPCVATVKEGDRVNKGDVIGVPPEGALGAKIHAGISGRVERITDTITIRKD